MTEVHFLVNRKQKDKKGLGNSGVVMYTFNPRTREVEAGGSQSLSPDWLKHCIPGQSGVILSNTDLRRKRRSREQGKS